MKSSKQLVIEINGFTLQIILPLSMFPTSRESRLISRRMFQIRESQFERELLKFVRTIQSSLFAEFCDGCIFPRFAPQGDEENAAGTGTKKARAQKKWATASRFQGGSLLTRGIFATNESLLHTAHSNLNKKRVVGPW